MAHYQHVYLSPHLDDAALSCGGMICTQTKSGERVLIVTVFAGRPDYTELSEFARFQHRWWGNPDDPVGQRRREDECACQILGADWAHLEGLDAIYRRDPATGQTLYNSDDDIFGSLHPADVVSAAELAETWLRELPLDHARVYAPLAAGHHVDHQLVRQAAIHLVERGVPIAFYEDFPYVSDAEKLVQALACAAPGGWQAQQILLAHDELERKKEAISCYVSQNPVIFRQGPGMAEQVAEYARRVGNGRPAERVWELILRSGQSERGVHLPPRRLRGDHLRRPVRQQ